MQQPKQQLERVHRLQSVIAFFDSFFSGTRVLEKLMKSLDSSEEGSKEERGRCS